MSVVVFELWAVEAFVFRLLLTIDVFFIVNVSCNSLKNEGTNILHCWADDHNIHYIAKKTTNLTLKFYAIFLFETSVHISTARCCISEYGSIQIIVISFEFVDEGVLISI
jgi:hypothetical protein